MNIYFLIGYIILLIFGFFIARKDTREGIIPDAWTNTGIIFAVIMYFFAFEFFSFKFYLYFTILVLLYLAFMYLQRAMSFFKLKLGTGDIKLFLLIYAFIPFNASVVYGIPLFTIMFYTLAITFFMAFYRILYYTLFNKVKAFRIMYGKSIDKTEIRLAPIVYLSLIIFFLILIF